MRRSLLLVLLLMISVPPFAAGKPRVLVTRYRCVIVTFEHGDPTVTGHI